MIEIRLSNYDNYREFVNDVEYFHKETAKQLLNFHSMTHEYNTDIVVKLIVGKVEIIIEHDVEEKGTQ